MEVVYSIFCFEHEFGASLYDMTFSSHEGGVRGSTGLDGGRR